MVWAYEEFWVQVSEYVFGFLFRAVHLQALGKTKNRQTSLEPFQKELLLGSKVIGIFLQTGREGQADCQCLVDL